MKNIGVIVNSVCLLQVSHVWLVNTKNALDDSKCTTNDSTLTHIL